MFNIEPSRVLPETALVVFRFKLLIYLGALREKKKKKKNDLVQVIQEFWVRTFNGSLKWLLSRTFSLRDL